MQVFSALGVDRRREIVEALAEGELNVTELSERFGMPQPAMSRHLRILREHGLVLSQVRGQQRIYRIDPRGFIELDSWLDRYRTSWAGRIDTSNRFLDAEPDR
ncbi:MAG TPA: metalloregulator ArsR/SmtB family transcription factor [Acidimicrobiales bacterium]|nr:metalloregulator ArsR/SmtB family transcription factor [Acidimicrobiales bacterium]